MPSRHVGLCTILVLESRLPEIGTNSIQGMYMHSQHMTSDMVIVEG